MSPLSNAPLSMFDDRSVMKVKMPIAGVAVDGSASMFGPGVAFADDYDRKAYSDVAAAMGSAGIKGVVSTVVGGKLPTDECMVTSPRPAPFIRAVNGGFERTSREVLLSLNCNAAVASAQEPGNSAASPEGRAAIKLTDSPTSRQHPEPCAKAEAKKPEMAPYFDGCHESDGE